MNRRRTFVDRERVPPPPIGVWLATGTPVHKPYPCRCRGNCEEQRYPCYCNGRTDLRGLTSDCCAVRAAQLQIGQTA
jgi:hypothetical protein